MSVTKIPNESLLEHVSEYDTILLTANIYGTMRNGIAFDVKTFYKYVYEDNQATKYGDPDKLGTILESTREGQPTFTLCYIIKYPNARPDLRKDCLEYDALESCLSLVNVLYKGKKVALTHLGCNKDGHGDKERVEQIINDKLTNVDAYLYDEGWNAFERWYGAYAKGIHILKTEGKDAYKEYLKESKEKFAFLSKKKKTENK